MKNIEGIRWVGVVELANECGMTDGEIKNIVKKRPRIKPKPEFITSTKPKDK